MTKREVTHKQKDILIVAILAAIAIVWLSSLSRKDPAIFTKQVSGNYDAKAKIVSLAGRDVGDAFFYSGPHGVIIDVFAKKLPSGRKGMHIHNKGVCDGEVDFKSAGPHVNMMAKEHGLLNPKGPHEGNLPNLIVNKHGVAEAQFFNSYLKLSDLLDADGSTLVIHEAEDDHFTQPLGGSGKRIACGKIEGIITQ